VCLTLDPLTRCSGSDPHPLGVKDGAALPRIAAQFRRGDLLEPLKKAFLQAPKTRVPRSVARVREHRKLASQAEVVPIRKSARPTSRATALNDKEKKVLGAFRAHNDATIEGLAERAFPGEARGNSWVRNALRKLRELDLVTRVASGTYRASRARAS
jgi:hypothetical protein